MVIDDLGSPFYLDLMRGIDEVAGANDSLVMFANTFRQADREVAQVQAMDEQRVRGLIVTTGEATDSRTRRMAQGGTPCVIIARKVENPPPGMHSISLDNLQAGRLIAGHLTECGRSSVGALISQNQSSQSRPSQTERTAGLRRGLAELGLPLPEGSVATAKTESEVDDAVGSLLARARDSGEPLDAIVCMTGRLTVAAHSALAARGIGIPDDIAFLTMDDFAWAAALGITVITQPSYRMGQRAAELVVERPATPAQLVFEPTLLARTSCGEKHTRPR